MKSVAEAFPEVLLLDTTYRVNNRKMPLASVMAVDGEGHGQIVAHALIAADTRNAWKTFLEFFKVNMKGSS